MKVSIIGYGFVGKALAGGLNKNVEVLKVDPILNTGINNLINFNPDVTFICVPTPMDKDSSQDISILINVINEIKQLHLKSLIVLKSTVLPNNIKEIEKLLPEFVYNPEFLREKHAIQDFIDSKLIVFGGNKTSSNLLADFYKNYTKCIHKDYIFTDIISASLIKYTINSYLATKVTFFNELKQLFQASEAQDSWSNFIDALSRDERIGNSHMQVPGHDGRLGFGGACLPKDSNAFLIYADSKNIDLNILKSAINTNNSIRASYNNLTKRELEQNIKFKGDS